MEKILFLDETQLNFTARIASPKEEGLALGIEGSYEPITETVDGKGQVTWKELRLTLRFVCVVLSVAVAWPT